MQAENEVKPLTSSLLGASPTPEDSPRTTGPNLDEMPITSLIDQRLSFRGETRLEEVDQVFHQTGHTYGAVTSDNRALGLCSKEVIEFLLQATISERDHLNDPVSEHILPNPLFVPESTSINRVLETAFARQGAEFLHHVIVVDDLQRRKFIGLIPIRNLVDIQSRLLTEQVKKLRDKEDLLRQTIQQQFRNTVELRRAQNRDNNYKQILRQTVQQQFRTTMELRRSQARYHMLFEKSGVGVALMDSNGQMSTCNRFLASLLDLPPSSSKELIPFCNYLLPGNHEEFTQTLKNLENQGEKAGTAHLEFPVKVRSDKENVFHFTLNFIPETSQHCVCVADVTEERRLQKHLLQKEKDVLLDSLVGGIAHELNNKVLPLLGYTELLMAEANSTIDPERIQHYGEIIKRSSSDCASIVRQLLQLCKPVSNKVSSCDLRAVTKEAMSFLLFRIKEAGVTVNEVYGEDETSIMIDPGQLKQILINLCLNAVDAMQESPSKVLTVAGLVRDGWAVVDVTDTGTGIRPEIIAKIFDPFFTTKQAETARGLGLSVCRSIARQHRGEILVESTIGKGTTFTLRLPLLKATAPAATAAPSNSVHTVASTQNKAPRVLIVDDEEFVGGLVKEVLKRKLKAESDRAGNGQEATEKLKTNKYDLIISDVRMPVMNGAELMRWVHDNQSEMLSRFFFMTGHEGSNTTSDEIAKSNIPVLHKPFTVDALLAQCQKILS